MSDEGVEIDPPQILACRKCGSVEHRRCNKRKRMRAVTINCGREMTQSEIAAARALEMPRVKRPKMRGDCLTADQKRHLWERDHPGLPAGVAPSFKDGINCERPCPFVSCERHLYLDVDERIGSIKLNFPDLDVWDMKETCSLDVADRGGITLDAVGDIMNLTRERVRQLEIRAGLGVKQAVPPDLREQFELRIAAGSAGVGRVLDAGPVGLSGGSDEVDDAAAPGAECDPDLPDEPLDDG